MKRLYEVFSRHQNVVALAVLVCLMTIGTSLYLIIPRAKSASNYDQLIESLGGEDAVRSSWDEAPDSDDAFTQSSNKKTSYKDTEEYKSKQSEIDYKTERYTELVEDKLVVSLDTLISDFFTTYTSYLQNQSPANSKELSKHVTTACMSYILSNSNKDKGTYLVNYTRFSDLNKETILAYVEMRLDGPSFLVSCVKNANGEWMVDSFSKVK